MRNTHLTQTTARMYVYQFNYNEQWQLKQKLHVKVSTVTVNGDICWKQNKKKIKQ